MANVSEKVSSYTVFLYGGPDGNSGADATVSLGIPDAFVFLRFYQEGATLPANSKSINQPTGKPIYYVSYRYDQLANAIDLLRNEKPITFFWNETSLAAYIKTGSEAVGEGE